MEYAARFPEIDVTDLREMRDNNQNKNIQRSSRAWIKVFDMWSAERSEGRKLQIPEHELSLPILCRDKKAKRMLYN